jgi:hypothetical protein
MLLAALGGCSSFQQGSDPGLRSYADGRVAPIPGPTQPSWTEQDRLPRSYQYQYAGGSANPGVGPLAGARSAAGSGVTTVALNQPAGTPSPILLGPGAASTAALASDAGTPHMADRPASLPETDKASAPAVPPAKPEPIVPPGKPEDSVPSKTSKPAMDPGGIVTLDHQANLPSPPAVRMVNSKRITINYEVKDVGPSGVSGVELWYTQDGKSWKKRDVPPQTQPPYIIEVNEEGLYGFTLLAKNGIGLSKDPPQSGDLPQVWVEVDLTSPVVHLTGVNAKCSHNKQNVVIRWNATDKNLAPKPITLSYAAKAGGPWSPIATHIENTGRYEWPLPADFPSRFLIRVEAADAVGNIGMDQTPKPVLMDRAQPTVSITNIESGK